MNMLKDQVSLVISEYMRQLNNESIIVSVSGGVDSMALLHAATPYRPHVVHFNHQVREDSDIDVSIVKAYCEKHHLTHDVFYLDVPEKNFQHEAHMMRQEKLIIVAENRHIKHVLTAHHADDQNETILMRLIRGSDLSGYSGLNVVEKISGVHFHKPLLQLSKNILIHYVNKHHVPHHQDTSNDEDAYLRNRLRHHVLPKLQNENPNLKETMNRYHEQLDMAYDFIKQEARKYSMQNMSRKVFNSLHPAIQTQLIITFFRDHDVLYAYENIKSAIEMLGSNTANGELHVSSGKKFIVSYDSFKIILQEKMAFHAIELNNGIHVLGDKQFSIFFDNDLRIKDCSIKLCYNKSALPFIARYRLDGDQLAFSFGHKKLKDFLIDKKVPKHLRDQLIIIVDQNNTILWVENLYINQTIQTSNTLGIDIKGGSHAT